MSVIELIAKHLDEGNPDIKTFSGDLLYGQCAVTGRVGNCRIRKLLLGKDFTNTDLLRAPSSDKVSVEACATLGFKWERMSSWFVSVDKFEVRIDKKRMREIVLNGSDAAPWALYITTSYKKHGALTTPENFQKYGVVRFENISVDCRDNATVRDWWDRLNDALEKFSRTSIETLAPNSFETKNSAGAWDDFEDWAFDKYRSALYSLLLYLLPSKAERDEVNGSIS